MFYQNMAYGGGGFEFSSSAAFQWDIVEVLDVEVKWTKNVDRFRFPSARKVTPISGVIMKWCFQLC